MTSNLVEYLRSFEDECRRVARFDESSGGEDLAWALIYAWRSLEAVAMDRLEGRVLAQTLDELEESLAGMSREARERRLRSPELQALLKGRCTEVREPGPDARGPACLVLVGLRDEDLDDVAWILGDGYAIKKYWVEEPGWAYGPPYWPLGSVLEGLEGRHIHIAEVA